MLGLKFNHVSKRGHSFGADNGLAPNRQKTLICINHGLLYWLIYASFIRPWWVNLTAAWNKTDRLVWDYDSVLWIIEEGYANDMTVGIDFCRTCKMHRDHFVYMHPANERRRYIVTSSLIGWVHTQHPANERRRYIVTLSLIGWVHTQHPANERRRYIVTSPLIGWVHTQNGIHPMNDGYGSCFVGFCCGLIINLTYYAKKRWTHDGPLWREPTWGSVDSPHKGSIMMFSLSLTQQPAE